MSAVIQGTADVGGKLSQREVSNTVDFCLNAFQHHDVEKTQEVQKKIEATEANNAATAETEVRVQEKASANPEGLTDEEMNILKTIRAREMLNLEEQLNIDSFGTDAINGFAPLVMRGNLSLVKVSPQSGRQSGKNDNSSFKAAKPHSNVKAWEDVSLGQDVKATA